MIDLLEKQKSWCGKDTNPSGGYLWAFTYSGVGNLLEV